MRVGLHIGMVLLCVVSIAAAQEGYRVAWTNQVGGDRDEAFAIAVDGEGNSYLAGYTVGDLGGTNAGGTDVFLRKNTPHGGELWTVQIGTSSYEEPRSATLDASGDVYVTGFTDGSLGSASAGGRDAFLIKFGSDGEELWGVNIGTDSTEEGNSVILDSGGNVLVGGVTFGDISGTNAGAWDVFLVKFDGNGDELWRFQAGSEDPDECFSIACDGEGNVYITGATRGDFAGTNAGDTDAFLLKVNSDGEEVWRRQIGSSGREESRSVVVDDSGNAYIFGFTSGDLGGTNAGDMDAFIAKYDPDGNELWIQQAATEGYDEGFVSAGMGSDGSLFVLGSSSGFAAENVESGPFLSRFDSEGNRQWSLAVLAGQFAEGMAVTVDASDTVYVVGGRFVTKCVAGATIPLVIDENAEPTTSVAATDPFPIAWEAQFEIRESDRARGVATDSAGNIYVVGYSEHDAFLLKLNAAGDEMWTQPIRTGGRDEAFSIAVTSSDDVYVCGNTSGSLGGGNAGENDIFLCKFNSEGTELWAVQLGIESQDRAFAVASDDAGNAYVIGLGGPEVGTFVAKFNGQGDTVWQNYLDVDGYGWSISVSVSGDIYVGSVGEDESYVTKLNSDGDEQWVASVPAGGTGGYLDGVSVAVDASDNAFLCGYTDRELVSPVAGESDGFLCRFNSDGSTSWVRQIGSSGREEITSLVVDELGNVYVTGYTDGDVGGDNAGRDDIFVIAFASSGDEMWRSQVGTPTGQQSHGIAMDDWGNIVVVGTTYGQLDGSVEEQGYDAFVIKYENPSSPDQPVPEPVDTQTGAETVAAYEVTASLQLGTPETDMSWAVTTDASGNVYMVGDTVGVLGTANAGSSDIFVTKLDPDGNEVWTTQLGSSESEYAQAVAVDASGNVYVVGPTWGDLGGAHGGSDIHLSKLSADGEVIWTKQIGTATADDGVGVAIGPSGDVYICGASRGDLGGSNAGDWDAVLCKFDSDGNQVWIAQLGTAGEDGARSLAVDASGDIYIAGHTQGDFEDPQAELPRSFLTPAYAFVSKFDSEGTEVWTTRVDEHDWCGATSLALGPDGDIYISGGLMSPPGGRVPCPNVFVACLDRDGNEAWFETFGGWESTDVSNALAIDDAGDIYVCGTTNGDMVGTNAGDKDIFLGKLSAEGDRLWLRQVGTPAMDQAHGIAVGIDGAVYISGRTAGDLAGDSLGNMDAFLLKYSPVAGGE